MKINFSPPVFQCNKFPTFLLITGIMLLSIAPGCQKNEFDEKNKHGTPATVRSFFSQNLSTLPDEVKRVADEIKLQNEVVQNQLVNGLISRYGYALWDKSMVIKPSRKLIAASLNKSSSGSAKTKVIVPLIKKGDIQVNSYLEAVMGDTISMKIHTSGEYSRYAFSNSSQRINHSERAAIRFMNLSKNVFGNEKFEITDRRLFSGYRKAMDTSGKMKVELKSKIAPDEMRMVELCVDLIVTTMDWYCGTPNYPGCQPNCDHCGGPCYPVYASSIVGSVCETWWEDGDPHGGEGGEGGNPGGGSPPPGEGDPCDNGGLIINRQLPPDPCDGNGDPGWVPVEEENLTTLLGLNTEQSNWLAQHEFQAVDIYKYFQRSTLANKHEICLEHINRMMDDPGYLSFVENHKLTGDRRLMWWEDEEWLESFGGIGFGDWAIEYLNDNPNVSFEIFQNQFMGKSEGQDGEYDAAYWEDPNLTFPQQNLPSWSAFEAAYPKHGDPLYDTPIEVYTKIGGSILEQYNSNPPKYQNTCALRISKALNYSGVNIPEGEGRYKGADGKYYFLSAKALLVWMKKTFGTPTGSNHLLGSQGGTNGQNFPGLVGMKKGIYMMIPNYPGNNYFGASGHADMIEGGSCDGGCYFNAKGGVHEIFIWELQ